MSNNNNGDTTNFGLIYLDSMNRKQNCLQLPEMKEFMLNQ